MIFWTIILLASLIAAIRIFLLKPSFGASPRGERLRRIQASPQYAHGKFNNISPTPNFTNGANIFTVLKDFLKKHPLRAPKTIVPVVKNSFNNISDKEDLLIWFGHSSYYLQLTGIRILTDPVFSNHLGPLNFTGKAFNGTTEFPIDQLPEIDYLLITHDHWDHLDYQTILKLKNKTKKIITGLGTGEHLEFWGIPPEKIIELDWHETYRQNNFTITAAPARHFSGRGLKRDNTLWVSFVVQMANWNIYLGGDSGYDSHFKQIGEQYGPFNLAILENGQYNKSWQQIHMMPEEVIQAGKELKAANILPVHWGKFSLSFHSWNEPAQRVVTAAKNEGIPVTLPRIGEIVHLQQLDKFVTENWWE